MFYNTFYIVTISVLSLKYQLCDGKCENYYLLLERYLDTDLGGEQYKTFSTANKKWTVLDVNMNKTVDSFDMNCVLDLQCNIQTEIINIRKPSAAIGRSFTFGANPKVPLISTTPYSLQTETDPTLIEARNSTTPPDAGTMADPTTQSAPTTSYNPTPTTTQEDYTTEDQSMFETEQTDTTTKNLNEPGVERTTDDRIEPETTLNSPDVETTSTVPLTPESTTQVLRNTTDDGRKTPGALYAGTDPKESQMLAGKIVAGTLGAVSGGIVIFVAKMLIQQYLQSGVYRLPNP